MLNQMSCPTPILEKLAPRLASHAPLLHGGLLQRKCACEEDSEQEKEPRGTLQRKAAGSTLPASIPPLVHDFSRIPIYSGDANGCTRPARIQAKLAINQPGDEYEQEADRVAGEIVLSPGLQRGSHMPGGQAEPLIRRRVMEGGSAEAEAPAIVDEVLRSSGQPLDRSSREFFEDRFGHELGRVRVHHDARAAESAQAVNAQAYTSGQDVVFAAGKYDPSSLDGKRLLAHELTHVIQQGGAICHTSGTAPAVQQGNVQSVTRVQYGLIQRSLGTYVKAMNQDPPDWYTAALHLNGESPSTIRQMLKNLGDPRRIAKLHKAARGGAGLGPCSNIALLTEPFYLKLNPGEKPIDREGCKKPSAPAGRKAPVNTKLVDMIDNGQIGDALALLEAMKDDELVQTLTKLYADNVFAYISLVSKAETPNGGGIKNQRLRDAFVATGFGYKERYVDNYMSCSVDPSSYGKPDPERVKQGKWNLKFICSYSVTPDVHLTIYVDDISDSEGGSPTDTYLGAGGLLYPRILTKSTVPRLWQRKKRIIEELEGGHNVLFITQAYLGAEAGLGAVQMGQSLLTLSIPAATQPGAIAGGGGRVMSAPEGQPRGSTPDEPVEVGAPGRRPGSSPEPVGPQQGKQAAAGRKVIPIEEGRLIRARKAARAADMPAEQELAQASGDRPRASSGSGKKPSGNVVSGGDVEAEVNAPKTQTRESSGSGGTNLPPEKPPVGVEARARGGAIEVEHLDSMPEYSRPKETNFPGIDAWKGGRETVRNTKSGRTRIISGADVLQVKSVGSSNEASIRARVNEGIKGLEPDIYAAGNTRVVNPSSRRLDVLFDEGALPEVSSGTRKLLTDLSEAAGNKGIELRWFRYSAGRKVPIKVP
jgi:hypothetical protein